MWVSATLPDVVQARVNAPLVRPTLSLKETARSPAAGKLLVPAVGVVEVTTGGGFGAAKVWPALQPPKLAVAAACQLKWAAVVPLPARRSERPAASEPDSETGRFTLVRPAAGPLLAVITPS